MSGRWRPSMFGWGYGQWMQGMGNPVVHEVVNVGWTAANRWSRGFVPPLRREQRYDLFERYKVHVVGDDDCDLTEAVRTGLKGGGHDIVVDADDIEALVFVDPTPESLLRWLPSTHLTHVRRLGLVSTGDHYWDLFGRSDPIHARALLCEELLPRCRHDCSLQWNGLPHAAAASSSSSSSRRRFLSLLYDTYNDEF
mmetsp:Transcript_17423/g.56518  ORF Transcript_17423/g.56518 Transcript_17423/m.56518 type:complete len:196 (-) Transcript_17423:58-645(-)